MNLCLPVDSAILPDLRAFVTCLSHLPVEVQMDVLRDGTEQIMGALAAYTCPQSEVSN